MSSTRLHPVLVTFGAANGLWIVWNVQAAMTDFVVIAAYAVVPLVAAAVTLRRRDARRSISKIPRN